MNTDNLENTKLKKWEAPMVLELQMDDTESGALPIVEAGHTGGSGSGLLSS
jgi:hypothetical protein